jgi:hypothetical protein
MLLEPGGVYRFEVDLRATAQTFQGGPAASYAREMERLSAKESLLLAVSPLSLPVSCSRR